MDYEDLNIRDVIWKNISGNVGRSGKQKFLILFEKNIIFVGI